jgi:hypothetical protein
MLLGPGFRDTMRWEYCRGREPVCGLRRFGYL